MRLRLLFALLIFTNIIWATTETPPPSNDNFANAIPVSCGGNYTASTAEATLDENNAPDGFGADLDAPNIWYSYTGNGIPETITLDLCASGYDTSYLIYTGTSGNLTLVAGNDDNEGQCGPGYRSYGTFESDGITTYYITITGYNPTSIGAVDLTVSCLPADIVYITDANFEQALIDLGIDSGTVNGYVSVADVDQVNDLNISNKNITSLSGIEAFTALEILICNNNAIRSINLENQPSLTLLNCSDNDLTFLSVKNGNNTNITSFNALNNFDLACIEVDNTAYSTTNWTNIDSGVSFTQNDCTNVTFVPDDNFEQYLIDQGLDDVLDNYVLTNNINTIEVFSISSRQIHDLTGIGGFTALEELNCTSNELTSLDLSQNVALRRLKCYFNELTSINLTQNTALERLECFVNNLTTIDLTQNTALNYLRAELNPLGTLDLSQNLVLDYINLSRTQLTAINLTANVALENIVLTNNLLTSIDVSQNVNVKGLFVDDNSLTSINVVTNQALQQFYCDNNAIEYLDLSNNTQLVSLQASNNALTGIDLKSGNNTILPSAIGGFFDVTGNPNLTCIEVDDVAYSTTNWTDIDPGLTFSTNCNPSPIPPNDECVDAIPVPISDGGCNTTVSGTLAGATDSNVYQCFGNTNSFSDVWYSFVATDTAHDIKILNTSGINSSVFHTVIDAQTYSCGNITDAVYCTDALERQATGLTIGDTYYIQVFTDVANSTETFDVCVSTLNIPGQTYVPDDNFEQALIDLGYDDVLDDYVTTANINTVETLDVSSENIADLTGIQGFTALKNLKCTSNNLISLDVTQNTVLEILDFGLNNITAIDITQNTVLKILRFQQNSLSSIDVSQNVDLEIFAGMFNGLQSLDVTNNTKLTLLNCWSNGIDEIDLSQNPDLEFLSMRINDLVSLDISANPVLRSLDCHANELTSLNVQNGNNSNFTTFVATNNSTLNCIQVDDVTYSTTNWTQISSGSSFSTDCGYLENDECVDAILVPISDGGCNTTVSGTLAGATDSNVYQCFGNTNSFSDVWYSFVATDTAHDIKILNTSGINSSVFHTVIDAQTYSCGNITDAVYCTDALERQATGLTIGDTYYIQVFTDVANSTETFDVCVSTNTIPGQTYVPDDNFEQTLIDLGYDTTLDNYVTTANINTITSLNVVGKNIASLTGLEDFTALQSLDFSINNVTTVDLTQNAQLRFLLLTGNSLATINVSQNPLLRGLTVEENLLTTIDVTQNPLLESLNISKNLFTSIDVTQNAGLTNLDVGENSLSQINVTQNPVLAFLTLDKNNFSAVDVTNNPLLSSLSVEENSLTTIDITQNPVLLGAYFGYNQLTTIDVSQNLALETLVVTANSQISTIDVSVNAALKNLRINSTQISEVNVSNNLNLEGLSVSNCPITGVDLTANVALQNLGVVGSQLTTIDVSQNPAFVSLFCSNTSTLTSVNIQNGNNTNVTTFFALNTPNLTCVQVDNVAYSAANWSNVDAGINFSANCGFPVNNTCVTAINVPISGIACNNVIEATIVGATNSNSLQCFGNNANFTDVWFSFVATETTHKIALQNLTGSPNFLWHSLIDAQAYTCGNITDAIYCTDALEDTATGLTIGNTYYIQVYSHVANANTTFDICVTSFAIPGQTYVPDDNFEQALIDLGYDITLDNYVTTTNISGIENLNISERSIADLTGIEDFTALKELRCETNNLTNLNITQNTQLTLVHAFNNTLTNVDFTQNTALVQLFISNNQLSTIDVSQNTALVDLGIFTNPQLGSIDVSNNSNLKTLNISYTPVSEIDVSNNLALERLSFVDCPISEIDVTANLELRQLSTSQSLVTSVDVSGNPLFEWISCRNSPLLTQLNLQNGNNTNFVFFLATDTPNLTCIQVDNAAYSTANWTNITPGTSFSTDCGYLTNDECVDAINVPISDATCNNVIAATMAGATNSNSLQCFGNNVNFTDVWFSFVATETTHKIALQNLTGSPNFLWHALIDAETYTCGNITDAIYCTDALEGEATGLTIGNTYYIQVYSHVANANTTFDICVSTNSIPGQTYVPDDNFEQALIDLGLDTTLDDYVTTANINTVNDLNIRNLGIFDLTGIEDFAALEILNCGLNFLGELDLSQNTNLNYLIADNAALVALNMQNGNNTNVTTFVTLGNVDLFCIQVDNAAYSTANWTIIEAMTSFSEYCGNPIQLAAKVYLQGAMLQNTDGFMRTDLKDNNHILTVSPYTDATAILATDPVFTATGQDKIVDWIWVELRDAANPSVVLNGKSALLQRDGDIVEALSDNTSTPVNFARAPGDYYVVIKHRNHLGIMLNMTISFTNMVTAVDFTDGNNQITHGANAQTTFGMPANTVGMWCGNVNGDGVVQYSGTNPDAPAILSTVLNDPDNFLNFPTFTVSGYEVNDVNMDGSTQYTGTNPDTPLILQNVLAHPGNFLNFSTYQIVEQLPQNE
ncbi:internalin-J [Kordia sp. SMS9]|uniref:leucine-rich repeat domain-containing protein n=1 Tax=Kordia sp. SMS9 TaxID=2282170 RepID=UPI000E0D0DEA|nr:hypothetical protein [Kordia sp. SMS9]AXG67857.1 internalin-J [Kordia sp. SMS9]